MKTSLSNSENQGRKGSSALALLALSLLLVSSVSAIGVVKASGYDDLQVFVSTASSAPYTYTVTAYNYSGSQVATYQSNYSAAAFELPSGEYLITVSAVSQQGACDFCMYPMIPANSSVTNSTNTSQAATEAPVQFAALFVSMNSTTSQGNSTTPQSNSTVVPTVLYMGSANSTQAGGNSTGGNSTTGPIPVIKLFQPQSEYGYAVVDVTSSQTITIDTQNIASFPTSQVQVKVAFDNGTAVTNASVSASVVGQEYAWWDGNSSVSMSAQTGSNGIATLTLPVAPVVITAWDWVAVPFPGHSNVTNVDVGGQEVNVTQVWDLQPAYVGLSGSALLIPPATESSITLTYQQSTVWAVPANSQTGTVTVGESGNGTVPTPPTSVPAQVEQATAAGGKNSYYDPAQIPSIGYSQESVTGGQVVGGSVVGWMAAAAAVAAMVVLAGVVLSRRQHPQRPQA